MRLDCHIHTTYGRTTKDELLLRLGKAGLDGGIVFSMNLPIPVKR